MVAAKPHLAGAGEASASVPGREELSGDTQAGSRMPLHSRHVRVCRDRL